VFHANTSLFFIITQFFGLCKRGVDRPIFPPAPKKPLAVCSLSIKVREVLLHKKRIPVFYGAPSGRPTAYSLLSQATAGTTLSTCLRQVKSQLLYPEQTACGLFVEHKGAGSFIA
jgi:hypothetical protein